jgi:hypothetical protein
MFLLVPIVRRLLILFAVLAVPVVAAEILARHFIGAAVSSAVASRIGTHAHVSFGSTPILVQIAHGRLDDVSVSAANATIGGLGPLRLDASLRDVHLANVTALQGAIGSLRVVADAPPRVVGAMLAAPSCLLAITPTLRARLTRDPRIVVLPGRIDLLPPQGRGAEVRFVPSAAASAVRFRVSAAQVGGVPVARPRSCERRLAGLPFGVALRSAQAREGVLVLGFRGHGASFSALG